MSDSAIAQIDHALQELQALSVAEGRRAARGMPRPARRGRGRLGRWLIWGLGMLLALLLPFAVLVRTSVFLYQVHALHVWLSIALSIVLTGGVLTAYACVASWKLRRRLRPAAWILKSLLVIVALYCGYALAYVSAAHVKSPSVRATYTSLHPLLRLSVSTLILADADLVITDGQRQPEDYRRMGLSVRERSLHYAQPDGYAHAVDLRTKGRPEWENALMTAYFRLMGFNTLRHVGTADHLHVSLTR